MADHAAAHTAKEEGAAKGGLSPKLKVALLVGGIVLVQCLLAMFFLPGSQAESSPTESRRAAHGKMVAGKGAAGDDHRVPEGTGGEDREVDLGKFSLTAFDPNSNSTLLIDFRLFGTVVGEEESAAASSGGHGGGHGGHGSKPAEEVDNTKFGKLFKKSQHRFRDQVIVIIRNAQVADLADPSLGLIKRQILAKTNSLLGEPLLKEIIFSDFAVIEQ